MCSFIAVSGEEFKAMFKREEKFQSLNDFEENTYIVLIQYHRYDPGTLHVLIFSPKCFPFRFSSCFKHNCVMRTFLDNSYATNSLILIYKLLCMIYNQRLL